MTDKNSVKMDHQVFISYSTPDRQVADLICSRLESENIRCWLPHRDTLPGESWINEITEAVEKSKIVVLVFSSNTNQSQWAEDEILLALDKNIKILPFRIENTSPQGMLRVLRTHKQWLDAYPPPLEKHLDNLVKAVFVHLEKKYEKFLRGVDKEKVPVASKEDFNKETEKSQSRRRIIFFILAILLFAAAIFVVDTIYKSKMRERDNQAYEKALSEDTKHSYERYISRYPSGRHLEQVQKRLEELKEMSPDLYRLNLAPKIEVSKNKKGYWEAQYKEYGITMVYIPPGNFKMGQTEKEKEWLLKNVGKTDYNKYYKNETPEHEVFLSGYWIGKAEVTSEQYVTFLNDSGIDHKNGCQGNKCIDTKKDYRYSHIIGSKSKYYVEPGYESYPVTDISWYGAVEYCTWLSKKTGFDFKLPTEAQWEKAARWFVSVDGTRGFMFPWGDQEPDKTLANFNSDKTAPVNSYHKGASPYGLLNMAGNVWEWCSDWYDEKYYSKSAKENPIGPYNGKYRVRRGGGWNNMAISLRCAGRIEDTPSKRYSNVGFRLCQNPNNKGGIEID